MVISDGSYEFANDEELWRPTEVVDLLLEDHREDSVAYSKKRRPMSGFVVPKKREKKQSSPKKSQPSQLKSEEGHSNVIPFLELDSPMDS